MIAKLLYIITKRARPEYETAVSYLTTRVLKSNKREWYKSKRVRGRVNTISDKRIIGTTSLHNLNTWIDAAYNVNETWEGILVE